jgi:hypothetical protein
VFWGDSKVNSNTIFFLSVSDFASLGSDTVSFECRNGGHVNPPLFQDWSEAKKTYGIDQAKALVRFRLAHLREMQAVAAAEDIVKDSQIRDTEHLEVYYTEDALEEARRELKAWKADMPEESKDYVLYEGQEAVKVSSCLLLLAVQATRRG